MKSFRDWVAQAEASGELAAAKATLRASDEVYRALEELGISRAELARRLGTSQAYVTKILRGNVNFTLASLARLAQALDGELKLHIAPRDTHTRWIDAPFGSVDPDRRFTASATFETPRPRAVPRASRERDRKLVTRQTVEIPLADQRPGGPTDGGTTAAA